MIETYSMQINPSIKLSIFLRNFLILVNIMDILSLKKTEIFNVIFDLLKSFISQLNYFKIF